MAKVRGKRKVTVPKVLARLELDARLRRFDQATERLNLRARPVDAVAERGWTRAELYERRPGRPFR